MENEPANYPTSFADHLTEQYGERGTDTREEFEAGFEAFKLDVVLQELRTQRARSDLGAFS